MDDFLPEDLTAVARLVHLAGVLGRNVILSSATIPPDLTQGMYRAYQDGLCCYNAFSDQAKTMTAVWVDEFRSASSAIPLQQPNQYGLAHKNFIEKRVKKLRTQVVKRKAVVIPCQPQATKNLSWQSYHALIWRLFRRKLLEKCILMKMKERFCSAYPNGMAN